MARYLLDTTATVDYLRGRGDVIDLLSSLDRAGHRLCVCCITLAETYAGLRPQDNAKANALFGGLQYLYIGSQAARMAGQWRYDFARQGITLHLTDALIAAVAIEEEAILITANLKDFPMAGLQILPQPLR